MVPARGPGVGVGNDVAVGLGIRVDVSAAGTNVWAGVVTVALAEQPTK